MRPGREPAGRRPLLQLLVIGDDEDDRELALVAEHYGVGDELVEFDLVLDRLRGDVLPARGLQEVFLAVRDFEIAVPVELADVAGAEPPSGVEDRLGLVGLVVVALHDVGALGEDLSIGSDLELHARDHRSHRAQLGAVDRVQRQHRRGLRQLIALDDRQVGAEEELGDLHRERGAAGDEEPDAASGPGAQLREHQPVGDGAPEREPGRDGDARETVVRPLLADPLRPEEDLALDRGAGEGVLQDAGIHLLVQPRHRDDDRGVHLAQVRRDLVE